MGALTSLDLDQIHAIAVNSPAVRDEMVSAAHSIYREIYETAPRTYKHAYSYRDHFRIWTTRNSVQDGYRVYLIAERFQWRFIEFGWREWRDEKPHQGLYIMTNALLKHRIG
ncbi:hypothetical protein [Nonomuraea recticatena]|uniref:Uncharacterized protein n=1 Tax=Nonomuraea recticatena TaxID=46178 RepID=A0ABN3S0Z9_9ACTN